GGDVPGDDLRDRPSLLLFRGRFQSRLDALDRAVHRPRRAAPQGVVRSEDGEGGAGRVGPPEVVVGKLSAAPRSPDPEGGRPLVLRVARTPRRWSILVLRRRDRGPREDRRAGS